jgi:hypothetical protein
MSMNEIITFCVDCKEIMTPDSDKHCKADKSIVEGYKGGMHWNRSFYVNEIPEEFSWLRNHIKVKTEQKKLF